MWREGHDKTQTSQSQSGVYHGHYTVTSNSYEYPCKWK